MKKPDCLSSPTRLGRWAKSISTTLLVSASLVIPVSGQIAAWDFFGESSPATSSADLFNADLDSANTITRGSGAAASTATNSFRTTGFKNNGIATTDTDYFQVTLSAGAGKTLSLSTIDARFAGTGTFAASPGVSSQFAYSLDGTNFTLIGSPSVTTGTPATLSQISLAGISALQNISDTTTVTIRYYASGQTTTGGWGFNSPGAGQYGLAIGGTVAAPTAPTITSFAPTTGWGGTAVTITGTNFTGASAVSFNGLAASTFTVNSATEISATAPTGVTTGKISVTTPDGSATSVGDFTAANPNLPTITSFTPTTGWEFQVVTITGTNFTGASAVTFNGVAATGFTVNSATEISATTPSGVTTGKISVTTPVGSATSVADYTVVNPNLPVVGVFLPLSGWEGTVVAINGLNLAGASAVTFNGLAAASFTVIDTNNISAVVPAGVTTGKISVTTPVGVATSGEDFTADNPNRFTVALAQPTVLESATNPATTGTVTRYGPLISAPLSVTLTSSDTDSITVPATVEFAADQTVATFDVTVVDDDIPDGQKTVIITATHASYVQHSANLIVNDDPTDAWPLVINQYYEGASSDKYIEIKNISANPVELSEYRLTAWTNAAAENWKTNTGSPTSNTVFAPFSLPAGATYLIKGSTSAANPPYAASGANVTMSAVAGFNGNDSVVLYYSSQSIANIVDAFSVKVHTPELDAKDASFYRLTNDLGYNLTSGSSFLDFPAVWASDKTLTDVASAAITDEWYLKPYSLPTPPTLDTFVLGGGSATTSTGRVSLGYSATGGNASEYRVSESNDFTGASWQSISTGITFDLSAGTGTKTVYFQLRNLDGESLSLSDTIDVVAYTYNQSVLITQYYDPDSAGANNKYIELTNVSASPVDLTGWTLVRWGNQDAELYKITGSTIGSASGTVNLSDIGSLAAGQTVVVANTSAAALTPPAALSSVNINHNGNDSVAIYSGAYGTETLVDVIGFTNAGNEGADKSLVRLTNTQGFGFASGSSVTGFGAVWQEFTLAAVDGAGATANKKLGVYPGSPGIDYITWASSITGTGGAPADQDTDGDGIDNGAEYFMGTAGNAPTQNPPIINNKITWPMNPDATGVSYKVMTSENMATWNQAAANDVQVVGANLEFTVPQTAPKLFIRLEVTVD